MTPGADVLIAEEDRDIRHLVGVILGLAGIVAESVGNGGQALQGIRRDHHSVLVLDVGMSELSGLEVCQMVKADPATMDTRVLLMSCHSSLADLSAGCAAGADDFVAKPFPRKELVHRVRLLLDAANRRPQTV